MYPPWAIPNDPRIALSNMDAVFPNKEVIKVALERITDEEIHKLTDHWNPLPSRLEGITPKALELKLFQAIADVQLKSDQAQIPAIEQAAMERACKEIGEWLARKENTRPWRDDIFDLFLSDRDIEALKRGELPFKSELLGKGDKIKEGE